MEQQQRQVKKRNRKDLEARNSNDRPKKKKKARTAADDADAPSLHSSGLQAEELRQEKTKPKHASPGESSAHSVHKGKSAFNGSESENQHFHGEILHRENGKEEKTKKKVKERFCEVLEGVINADSRADEKKKKKKRKEKSVEQLEQGKFTKGITEEDHISREEEKSKEKRRKKENKKKKRKMKGDGEEELQEKKRCHLQSENITLMNGADITGSQNLACANLNRNFIQEEINKEKKKEKKKKKVTFEDHIVPTYQEKARDLLNEAQSPSDESSNNDVEEIWGLRFTPEEDAILKDAVWKYIKSKGWDENMGLDKVFNSKKHRDARNCWAEIKMSLPHRPRQAVRFRARLLLEPGSCLGKWSKEEEDLLKLLQQERGHKWREISSVLNRHRSSVKEKWRSLKRSNTMKQKGRWTQDELQQLSDLVHKSLQMNRLLANKKERLDRHILRDNITWENIADTLGTHNHGPCCSKWYYNLQSSLVADGHWDDQDDFVLLESLLESGASTEEEVEWDSLLEHRSGQVCLTRWKQMVKHLGENRTRQFLDKLDVLARRYAPELLETSVEDKSSKVLTSDTAQASQ